MKVFRFILFITISLFILSSCNKEGDNKATRNYLVDYQLFTPAVKFDIEGTKNLLNQNDLGVIADKVQYDIQIFKVTYKTRFMGDTVLASGVVAVPVPEKKNRVFPLLSYQHGTIVKKSDAPSVNTNNEYMTYMASTGMVVAISDYIGFGETANEFHPYLINEYTTSPVLDMIRAAKELVAAEDVFTLDGNLFMYGYSQGGSATLGSLSAIENDMKNSDINVTAAVCGAGAYDLGEMRKWIMKQTRYEQPFLIAYMLESFSKYENVGSDYSLVFSDEFASMIPDLFDGTKDGNTINASFGTFHVGELFNDNFENDAVFESDTSEYVPLVQAFEKNKLTAWPITASLSIHYGSEDVSVPGDQSLSLYKEFQNNGSGAKVKLERMDGLNHVTAFPASLSKAMSWFMSFSN